MRQQTVQRVLLALVAITLIVAFFLDSFLTIEPVATDDIVLWDSGWTISEGERIIARDVTLPYSLDGPYRDRTWKASRIMSDEFPNQNTAILVTTSMSSLTVSVDGSVIYSYDGPSKGWARPVFGGSTPHFIRIPYEMRGKELTLTYRYTSNNLFSGHIHQVKAGSKASLVISEMDCWPSLAFGFALLLVGFIIAISSLFIQQTTGRKSFFYLGAILLALGGWVFSQTPSKFLFIRNPALPMNLSFVALHVLPILLVNYIIHSYPIRHWIRYYAWAASLFLALYIITFFLQLFGIAQYTDLLLPSGGALVLFLLALFATLLYRYIKGAKALFSFLLALSCILLSIIAEVVFLALNIILNSAVVLHLSMVAAAIILFSHSLMLFKEHTTRILKEEMLLTIAYKDSLTGLSNRAAFDRDADEITTTAKRLTYGIIVMDINDLKRINDTEGHAKGDQILIDFAQRVARLLPEEAKLYRYGGDEFVALVNSVTIETMKEMTESIVTSFSTNNKIPYKVAAGCEVYIPTLKMKFGEVVSRADSAMYRCKNAMKQSAPHSPRP